jgi:hypothetical protein
MKLKKWQVERNIRAPSPAMRLVRAYLATRCDWQLLGSYNPTISTAASLLILRSVKSPPWGDHCAFLTLG